MKVFYLLLFIVLTTTPQAHALIDNQCLATVGPQCVAVPKPIAGMGCSLSASIALPERASAKLDKDAANIRVLVETLEMVIHDTVDSVSLPALPHEYLTREAMRDLIDNLMVE